jgi:carboxypeptidase Q
MQERGERIVVRLRMSARELPDRESRNVVGELVGRERPDEVVVLGGHIDSWDVGQGAMDDGGGVVAAWQALRVLKRLGLTPRRTIRVVGWTNEENGLRGGTAYRDAHREVLDRHVLAIESDAGVFAPQGFGFTGSDAAFAIVRDVGTLLEGIGAGRITRGGGGSDIGPIMREGVPGMGLNVDGTRASGTTMRTGTCWTSWTPGNEPVRRGTGGDGICGGGFAGPLPRWRPCGRNRSGKETAGLPR